jgi:MOSC domain-containing protein YiiM
VLTVNIGCSVDAAWAGRVKRTAIGKRPVSAAAGPIAVGRLGLAGDEQADKKHHGGYEQAVYAYARDDLDWWAAELRSELADGMFGENLTTADLDLSGALIGERWRLGTAVAEVTGPRIPCVVFQNWMAQPHWVARFAAAGRPGAYLRVVTEGVVAPGDRVVVLERPAVSVTVAESMRAFYGDRELLRRLLLVPGRSGTWDKVAQRVLGAVAVGRTPL